MLRRARQRAPNLSVGDRLLCWTANLRLLEIDEIKTVPYVPLSHPFVERLIGTMRREFLDHVLFWNARDLEHKLADFQVYYNPACGHASLAGETPVAVAGGRSVARAELSNARWVSHCRGLVQLPVAARQRIRDRHDAMRRNTSNEKLAVAPIWECDCAD